MNLANKITMVRILLIPVYVVLMILENYYLAGAVFILASITDFIDGHIARKYDMVTDFGKFTDPLADKLLVLSALLVFVEVSLIPAYIAIIILSREMAITSLRTMAALKGKVIAADKFGKIKTVFQLNALILMHFMELGSFIPTLSYILLYIALFLTILSGINYFIVNKDVF